MSIIWDFYITASDGKPVSVFLDMGIASQVPLKDFGIRLVACIRLNSQSPSGFPSAEEADVLETLEETLVKAVSAWGAIYVGRITLHGRREFHFYGSSAAGFDELVGKAVAGFGHAYATRDKEDPEWSFYSKVLYPSPFYWQCMMNRRVVEELRSNGDILSQPRCVDHWLYFSDAGDRDRCGQATEIQGFDRRPIPNAQAGSSNPFGLHLRRVDSVELPAIDNVCAILVSLAKAHNGKYDGWETQVVKAGSAPIEDTRCA